jgi:hypothetical protein
MKKLLSSQLLLNPSGDFDETWYKERSHCVDVHIIRGALSNIFKGVTAPGLVFLFEKYFVFATHPESFGKF